jgi:Tol biopolymer transport system component
MALGPGSRIGHFQVTALLGQGGMGTVYRATDGHLGRDVAIKVLSAAFWNDPERLARFEREARTLASLSHTNIAVVHGIEDGPDGTGRALVMELVEGPTLADLIAKGPIPISDALPIATQIADGLEAAHDHGIVHRDLKPANVKVRSDGTVKVLDFGLARSIDPASVSSSMSMSPTITTPAMTQAGVILGTAAYMSPEQARGKPVDRRTDVWAFGCVLFEMLAGRRPFGDEDTVSDTLAGILKSDPAWAALPADTPPKIRSVLERCLRKDVRRRLPHIAEARIEIEEAASEPSPRAQAAAAPAGRTGYLWPALAVGSLLAAAALAARIALAPPAAPQPVARFDITAPRDAVPMPGLGRTIEIGDPISPDGRTFAFLSRVKGTPMIWLRPLDSTELRPVARTEGAERPFWSPDGRSIAFFSDGQLKTLDLRTGAPMAVCKEAGRDIAWSTDNVILIGGQNKGLLRVAASGGEPVPVTELAPGETTHDYPHFLPDNRHFFYMARRGANLEDWDVYLGSLDSKERRLFEGIHTAVRYSPTGHLLFIQGLSLMAQPFDLDRLALRGDPMTVVDGISAGPRPLFGTSASGMLAYLTPDVVVDSQLAWVDRTGAQTVFASRGQYNRVSLAPDGRYAAFDRELDILLFDIERNATSSFVTRPGADVAPVFSADSNRIAFASGREPARNAGANNPGAGNLFERAVGTADDNLLRKDDAGKTPLDWSRDGHLLYTSLNDLWALPPPSAGGAKDPVRITKTPFIENSARFSPDGRWIAYHSNDSAAGQDVYVQSFPDGGRRRTVSVNGGTVPRWSRDGKELFYVAPDSAMMAVSISAAGPDLQIGKPVRLFQSRALQGNVNYDVARDRRFLLNVPVEDYPGNSLAVLVNWTSRLKK